MESLVNAWIGEYHVVASLGAGGMGEVYRAVHAHLGRTVAIKVLSPECAAEGPMLQRFYSEASIQASLNHPGVAEYLGFYQYQGRPCILMEYVDGETLAAVVERRGALPAEEAVGILREVAAAAAHFHAQGVVHRDLKSTNVKINSAGRVKILDFGIARQERTTRMTRVGAVVGTPEMLAPEQIRAEAPTPATDVWQLGVMLYELLTGRLPFQAETEHEMMARILMSPAAAPSQSQPGIPPWLDRVVGRCLEKSAGQRFPTAGELCQALGGSPMPHRGAAVAEAVSPGPAAPVLRWRALAPVALLVVVLAGAAWFLMLRPGVAPQPAGPAAGSGSAGVPAAAARDGELRTVVVDTMDGVAEVYRDGKREGSTPYRIEARAGTRIDLVLRRDGYRDLPLQFEASERRNYTYTMERLKGHTK